MTLTISFTYNKINLFLSLQVCFLFLLLRDGPEPKLWTPLHFWEVKIWMMVLEPITSFYIFRLFKKSCLEELLIGRAGWNLEFPVCSKFWNLVLFWFDLKLGSLRFLGSLLGCWNPEHLGTLSLGNLYFRVTPVPSSLSGEMAGYQAGFCRRPACGSLEVRWIHSRYICDRFWFEKSVFSNETLVYQKISSQC